MYAQHLKNRHFFINSAFLPGILNFSFWAKSCLIVICLRNVLKNQQSRSNLVAICVFSSVMKPKGKVITMQLGDNQINILDPGNSLDLSLIYNL